MTASSPVLPVPYGPGIGLASWYTAGRSDGFGDRLLMFDNSGAASFELLRFRPDVARETGFEGLLRQRVQRLTSFTHSGFAAVRTVERLEGSDELALVSSHVAGRRLTELLEAGRAVGGLHPAFVSWLVQQSTPLLASLQAHGYDIVHGALTLDRIVLTPEGRVAIVEHALGSALRGLEWSPNRLWREFGLVSRPTSRGDACLDARGDILQLGVAALSLLLGRRVTLSDLAVLPALIDEFSSLPTARASLFSAPLRQWLERALQTHPQPYSSAADAQQALRELPPQSTVSALPAMLNAMMPAGDLVPNARTSAVPPESSSIIDVDVEPTPLSSLSGPPERMPADEVRPSAEAAAPAEPAPAIDLATLLVPPSADLAVGENRSLDAGVSTDEVPAVAWSGSFTAGTAEPRRLRRWLVGGLAAIALAEAAVIAVMVSRRPAAPVPAAAMPLVVTLEAEQPGTAVFVDDRAAGTTPLRLTLDPSTQSIRLAALAPAAAGASAPPQPAAGGSGSALAQAAARQRSGGVRITSTIPLQVLEGDRVLGSTADGPIVTTAGTHQLDLVNDDLGFRTRQTVTVGPGQIVALTVTAPMGRLSLNAQPWAQVLLNQNVVGETPIANLAVPIGRHEVTFRHPQLGERRETVTVRANGVTRLSATFDR